MRETPPLTRGRHLKCPRLGRCWRNTPAYAGKTESCCGCLLACWKHPRLRGEDVGMVALQGEGLRNTPAYAGKTVMSSMEMGGDMETPPLTRGRPWLSHRATVSFRKHPRLRGEDRSHSARDVWPNRNTPAYAGKTVCFCRSTFAARKHPRLRGEDLSLTPPPLGNPETPPLTRGRLVEIRP